MKSILFFTYQLFTMSIIVFLGWSLILDARVSFLSIVFLQLVAMILQRGGIWFFTKQERNVFNSGRITGLQDAIDILQKDHS